MCYNITIGSAFIIWTLKGEVSMPKRKIGSVDENLGRNLIFFRKLAGLTQQQVADRLNLNRTTYTKYETGASEPSIEILKALAAILEVDVSLLLTDEMDPDLVEDVIEGYHHSADRFFSVWKQFDDLDEQERREIEEMLDTFSKKKINAENPLQTCRIML